MLDSIKELFATAPILAWSLVSVLVAVVLIASMWEGVKWWWMNTWMSFPVIGKIARYSKDTNHAKGYEGWLKSERALCMEYKKFVQVMSEHDYNEKVEYLVLAGDNGRSHMSGWLWPIIIGMVFVEAMGFSYVLAGFTIPGASENVQQYGAYGIAFLISALLIFLTHFAGHELYRNSKINEARSEWQQSGRKYDLRSGTVPLSKPQNIDADYPEYTRRINRIGSTIASYKVSIGTAIFVAIIAIGATYVRGQVLEKMLTEETASQTQKIETPAAAADGLDMSADVQLPAADQASDNAAQVKAVDDIASNDRHGGWGTFIILAFIFAGLQALGVYFGFKWGFAGQNSAQAFRAIGSGKFASYEAVLNYYNYVSDTAQSKLEELQQRIMERIANEGSSNIQTGSNTFRDFMKEQREVQSSDRDHQRGHARREAEARTVKAAPAGKPEPVVAAQTADLNPVTPMESEALDEAQATAESKPIDEPQANDAAPRMKQPPRVLEMALHQVNSLSSKENKMAFIKTLPVALQAEVVAALKAAKENEQVAQINSELEDLL